ncbi:MAG: VanZ family protein [Burkholderiaceae bacterium]|nr:VanZ family protein [Burkholderiaceae bacterium]
MQGVDRRVAGLWLGLLAFFVYGSWAPLAMQAQAPAEAWARFLALPAPWQGDASRTDLAANFLLTVPLAFGAAYLLGTLASRAWRWGLTTLLWPAMLLLSVGVEYGQVFFPPRTPSWTDVAMQVLGSTTGMALYALLGERARRWLAAFSAGLPAVDRLQRGLLAYLVLFLAWQLMPLDLSLNPVDLYRKWRDGRVLLPFSSLPPGVFDAGWQIGADLLLWMPVGALGWLTLRQTRPAGLALRALALVLVVEVLQLFVLSRVSDVTDLFVGTAGVMAGAGLARALRRWGDWPASRQRVLLQGALAAWALGTVAVLWLPFDFDAQRATAQAWWASVSRLPFATYLQRTEYGALGEILRKLAVFMPGGVLLALLARGQAPPAWPRLLALGAAALVLEAGQVLLPSKVADLTDAALGLLGGFVGWRLGRGLSQGLAGLGPVAGAAAPRAASGGERGPPREPVRAGTGAAWPAGGPWPGSAAGQRSPAAGLGALLVAVPALALLLWLLARVPGVPYNVGKLMPASGAGVVSALGVAAALAWMLAVPVWLLPARRRRWRLAFPLLLLGHGLLAFLVLHLSAPPAMLHKVIGTPVFGWGAASVLEDAGRYVALHAAFMTPLLGAMALVRLVTAPHTLADLLWWAAWALLLFVPVHGVVVAGAGTDNLVELMRGGGGVGASLALAAGWGALATAGTALAAALAAGAAPAGAPRPWRRGPLLVLGVLAGLAAPALLAAGLEPTLFKYGQLFSAAQFLLSAGRDAYVQGPELVLRAAVALAGAVALVALLQWPGWRALARAERARAARAPQGLGPWGGAAGSAG